MAILSKRILRDVTRVYRGRFALAPSVMAVSGETRPDPDLLSNVSSARRKRAHALHQSVAWGEPHTLSVVPGVLSWIVPMEDRQIIHGALIGGEVIPRDEADAGSKAIRHLVSSGVARSRAVGYVSQLPLWPRPRVADAAGFLETTFYEAAGWTPTLMRENRLKLQQQQQINRAIEDQKRQGLEGVYPFEKERVLLAYIRAGDQNGARKVLNETLAAMYMNSPKLVVLRARAIEMMGYLTRAAVEDSPLMESLIDRNHQWMARIIRAVDFEEVSHVLTDALDDFMDGIYLHGFNRSNARVTKAVDFISNHYCDRVTVDKVADHVGLSGFRISHLVKEHTGKTIGQLVRQLRIQRAQHLLKRTFKSCTEIAYEVGYSDQSYFIKHFKGLTGTTPARYRRTG